MRFKEVDIPEEILRAQSENKLVVFVGAGVSMAPPTNLPNFSGLVKEIAKGTDLEHEEIKVFDRALGDLERKQVDVKRLAGQILGDESRTYNENHLALLKLFKNDHSSVKIVTTNLDPHFTVAARELFPDIEEYHAPALPLGNDFSGIVYLHGSTQMGLKSFVLTDSDFGKAYLIDGWATKFIKDLFLSDHTVLFVGYSHDDTVMNYLSRGLPPSTNGRRFALTEITDGRWDRLGITPIVFPLEDNAENSFKELTDGLSAWAHHSSRGLLEHEKQMQEIVSQQPPLNQDEVDYILNRISDSNCIQFFMRHARDPSWIDWLDSKGLFSSLFVESGPLSHIERQLGYWLSENFFTEYPYQLLSLLERHNHVLHPIFWNQLAVGLWRKKKDGVSSDIFQIWVDLLLTKPHISKRDNIIDYLLNSCEVPDDHRAAISLLSALTKPYLKLEKRAYMPKPDELSDKEKLDADVEILGTLHWLVKSWDKLFRENLAMHIEELFFMCKHHLDLAYSILSPFDSEKYDSLSYQRSAIERSGQNHRLSDDFPVFLDFVADILKYVALENKNLSKIAIAWSASEKHLFKRMALFVMEKTVFFEADKKVEWLLENHCLYEYHTHHEVFCFLKEVYPKISIESRKKVLGKVISGPSEDYEQGPQWKDYPVFSVLSWLHDSDPKCKLANAELEKIQKKNPKYQPSDHPEFHSYIGGASWVNKSESPYEVSELLALNLNENLSELIKWEPQGPFSRDRAGLLAAIEEALKEDIDFSFRLASALIVEKNWETDLWIGLYRGWNKVQLSEENWNKVLKLPIEHTELLKYDYYLGSLLRDGVAKKDPGLPPGCYDLALDLADLMWKSGENKESDREEIKDWLNTSINHYSGNLAEFWLRLVSLMSPKDEKKIPERIQGQLETILSENSYQAQLARVIIASQTLFLFSYSKNWTVNNVLPLLDYERDKLTVKQAWDGYLAWGRWSEDLLEFLMPLFHKVFCNLEILGDNRERFIEFVAAICLYLESPNEDNWLFDFLKNLNADDREHFTHQLQWQFSKVKESSRENIWDNWLSEFISQRVDGKPLPLSDLEKISMIEVVIQAGDRFPEGVELILNSSAPKLENTLIYHTLRNKSTGSNFPKSTLNLFLYLLPPQSQDFYGCHDLEPIAETLIERLAGDDVAKESLLKLCDLLAQLKCPGASEIRSKIPD